MNLFSLINSRRTLFIFVLAGLLAGCSSLSDRKSLFGAREGTDPKTQVVSKAQYDQLLQKYQELLQKTKELEANKNVTPEVSVSGESPSEIVENLSQNTAQGELTETVDLFKTPSTPKSLDRTEKVVIDSPANIQNIENQIIALRKAWKYVESNEFNKAMSILKDIEDSNNKQIKVRAKFLIGEIFYKQQNYDLAMQVFEEIVHAHAFSGIILDVLRRLTVCGEKLKLSKKKELYFSMLHDFF